MPCAIYACVLAFLERRKRRFWIIFDKYEGYSKEERVPGRRNGIGDSLEGTIRMGCISGMPPDHLSPERQIVTNPFFPQDSNST
jgi:hypothetical protein